MGLIHARTPRHQWLIRISSVVILSALTFAAFAGTVDALRLTDGSGSTLWVWPAPGTQTFTGLWPTGQFRGTGNWELGKHGTNGGDR